jgi:hypothetical protein
VAAGESVLEIAHVCFVCLATGAFFFSGSWVWGLVGLLGEGM